jgi:predicted nucleic acid-binding protein
MILYLGASALVKRYLEEPGASEVREVVSRADVAGTSLISRAEVSAALAKAVRMDALTQDEAWDGLQVFRAEWPDLPQVQVTGTVIARADAFAWEHGLRGYDAVHLATAPVWQEMMCESVTLSTFDRRLWTTAKRVGLVPHPPELPALLDAWKAQAGRERDA